MNSKKVKQYILEKEQQYQTFRTDPNDAGIMWLCGDFESVERNDFLKYTIQEARNLWILSMEMGWKQYNG